MNLQKLLLMLIMSIVLGQSVLASADMHLVFEETDTHHSQHELNDTDSVSGSDHSGDDCGHCCHAHGCSLSMASHNYVMHLDAINELDVRYHESPYFYYSDPALRPPIT